MTVYVKVKFFKVMCFYTSEQTSTGTSVYKVRVQTLYTEETADTIAGRVVRFNNVSMPTFRGRKDLYLLRFLIMFWSMRKNFKIFNTVTVTFISENALKEDECHQLIYHSTSIITPHRRKTYQKTTLLMGAPIFFVFNVSDGKFYALIVGSSGVKAQNGAKNLERIISFARRKRSINELVTPFRGRDVKKNRLKCKNPLFYIYSIFNKNCESVILAAWTVLALNNRGRNTQPALTRRNTMPKISAQKNIKHILGLPEKMFVCKNMEQFFPRLGSPSRTIVLCNYRIQNRKCDTSFRQSSNCFEQNERRGGERRDNRVSSSKRIEKQVEDGSPEERQLDIRFLVQLGQIRSSYIGNGRYYNSLVTTIQAKYRNTYSECEMFCVPFLNTKRIYCNWSGIQEARVPRIFIPRELRRLYNISNSAQFYRCKVQRNGENFDNPAQITTITSINNPKLLNDIEDKNPAQTNSTFGKDDIARLPEKSNNHVNFQEFLELLGNIIHWICRRDRLVSDSWFFCQSFQFNDNNSHVTSVLTPFANIVILHRTNKYLCKQISIPKNKNLMPRVVE
ncbi:hypothetical protein WN51_13839 [Melipona quadrifasciata]|uniref:Uncharacterized protein n=1 Tax=Melipona quadrifasciata TaxID=166423 RepID=A0A0N0BFS2_9HYME|nr:hypothetical protein WN51_13839 [Melipona quadrifasciata]